MPAANFSITAIYDRFMNDDMWREITRFTHRSERPLSTLTSGHSPVGVDPSGTLPWSAFSVPLGSFWPPGTVESSGSITSWSKNTPKCISVPPLPDPHLDFTVAEIGRRLGITGARVRVLASRAKGRDTKTRCPVSRWTDERNAVLDLSRTPE
jgi:hypothetical protein